MSYHNTTTTPGAARQSATNAQGMTAPAGYHYMPDGSLMLDAEHAGLYGSKVIKGFELDTSDIKEVGGRRKFTVLGDKGAVFSLEIREGVNYYNFETGLFQTAQTKLVNATIGANFYGGSISFPKVAAGAQYDIYLFTENNTKHALYNEVRFPDNSIDINSTTGSNSNLIQKVIYQTLDVTLTLAGYSPNGTVTGTMGTQVITTSRNASLGIIPFSFIVTTGTSNTLAISKQPASGDVMAFVTATPGATPLEIEGEDLYPAVTQTDAVDGNFSAGTTHKIVMNTNVAAKMLVGDRVTIATTALTDTINGGSDTLVNRVVMDNNVITKMAVGDRVTMEERFTGKDFLDNNLVTVVALDPDGDNAKEFSVSEKISFADGATLTFTSKLNREVITVAALNPDTDNAKEFSMKDASGNSVNVGILDESVLSFSNQRNHRWSFDNIYNLSAGMRQLEKSTDLSVTYFTAQPTIKEYLAQTTVNEGQADEYKVDNVRVPALDALGALPVTTRNGTTKVETIAQAGNVTFSEQALLTFGGGANATVFSYGPSEINRLTGYDVEFTGLAVALTPITTTTTAASAGGSSTSVVIANRIGISDNISSVSGIGIDSSVANPTVASGAGSVTGAGTIVLSAAQSLESGITLAFPGAGSVATITGNIKVNKAGNENVVLRFDLEKFLTMQ